MATKIFIAYANPQKLEQNLAYLRRTDQDTAPPRSAEKSTIFFLPDKTGSIIQDGVSFSR
jgi:hypothetical protein